MTSSRIITIGMAVVLGISSYARTLSPNGEILLAEQQLNIKPGRFNSRTRTVVPAEISAVSACILLDSRDAIPALEALGVEIRHDYGKSVTASIPVEALGAVSGLDDIGYVYVGSQVNLLNDFARSEAGVNYLHDGSDPALPAPFTGKGVVVGLVDTGFEYGHIAFYSRDGQELRVKAVWDQTGSRGEAPTAFGYGVEYTTPEEILEATYDTGGEFHGTHTTGIAAGADMKSQYYGVAPDADIVLVSFGQEDVNIIDGIQYIFDYADKVDKPCVINLSLGSHYGPHNGTSIVDRFIDSRTGPGRIVVGACGNEGEYRLHASKTFTAGDTQLKSMLTFAQGISHKQHVLDIWGLTDSPIKVKLAVAHSLKGNILTETPEFDTANPPEYPVVKVFDIEDVGISCSIIISGEVNPVNGQPHVCVQSAIENIADGRVLAVIVEGEDGQQVDLWNVGCHEFSSNGKVGWTNGSVNGTVGELGGTAKSIISVGSYDARDRVVWVTGQYTPMSEANFTYDQYHRSVFSSCGPTADHRIVPDVLAAGMPVISAINKYAYRNLGFDLSYDTSAVTVADDGRKYYYAYNLGTSMSAPFVAGTVALMLEADPELTPERARQAIMATAQTSDYMGELPNNFYGAGRINSLECVKQLINSAGMHGLAADAGKVRVWPENGMINIVAGADATADVYSLMGVKVASFPVKAGLNTFVVPTLHTAIAVVRIEGKSFKVVL